jgi:thiosulfate/3-mercaptopyruvate sulfurtransferase
MYLSMKKITPIISPTDLISFITKRNLRVIDARVGKDIKTIFNEKHLIGAQHVDLDRDMAHIKANAADGGRHPLPDIQNFGTLLGNWGIDVGSHIIIYDAQNGSNAAARLWWMLKAIGHQKVQVLDGGWQAALAANMPTSNMPKKYKKKPAYPVQDWQLPQSNMSEVEQVAQNAAYTVIDVRSEERYQGKHEPIDLIAGHIPDAINMPFTNNLTSNGFFKSVAELQTLYAPIFLGKKTDNIIVHCGSGVTACHTLLAMAHAGYDVPKLYVGSWSEWSRNDKEMVTL